MIPYNYLRLTILFTLLSDLGSIVAYFKVKLDFECIRCNISVTLNRITDYVPC